MTETLSWVILAAGLALAAVMLNTAASRFEATWQTYQMLVPR